jgi:lysophospholipase L1-like esterase
MASISSRNPPFSSSPEPTSPASSSRLRKLPRLEVLLATATILVLVLMLGAVEGTLRLFDIGAAEAGTFGPLHVYSDVYGWTPRKSFRMADESGVTTINAHGYRGRALPAEKNVQTRVVVLGDSIGFGLEVGDEQTFSNVLDERNDVEVANLAVQGYDPGQELIKLEREALPLKPDVVVLALCLNNDFADAALPVFLYDGRHPKPFFRIEDGALVQHSEQLRLSLRHRLGLALSEHSRLYGLVAARRAAAVATPVAEVEHWSRRMKEALDDRAAAVGLTARLLGQMAEDCRKAGVEFVVLAFPDKPTFRGDTSWLDELRATPSLHGVTTVDMAERFRGRSLLFRDVALDGIGHLSVKGHQVAAEIIHDVLTERGLMARGPGVARPTS